MLLGPTALSMSGIICLTPLLSRFLRFALVPIWNFFGLDAGLLAGILAIDMGGYQLAGELSASQEMVRYAGLVIAATLGCTITFTIPVGMGMLKSGDRLLFSRGMLIGTGTLPVTMIVGGLLSGLSFLQIVLQSLPVLLFCFLLMFGIWRFPEQTVRAFTVFADVIRLLTTIGLIAGAFCYMTGFSLLPDLAPLEDAMAVLIPRPSKYFNRRTSPGLMIPAPCSLTSCRLISWERWCHRSMGASAPKYWTKSARTPFLPSPSFFLVISMV